MQINEILLRCSTAETALNSFHGNCVHMNVPIGVVTLHKW
jgi:hypothetical protein